MRAFPSLTVVSILTMAIGACRAEPTAPMESESSAGRVLLSFDRITLGRGDVTGFHASLVQPGGGLAAAGLTYVSRNPAVAAVRGTSGRVQAQGLAAGRTWILVRSGSVADSVEVVVQ